ncbi:MAG: lysylphosphatidylglycerol synthase transmembrane domain-containing protein [Polyangia bacterium]
MSAVAITKEDPELADELPSSLVRRPPLWRWILAILIPAVALVWVVRRVDMHDLGAALARANMGIVALAGVLFVVGNTGVSGVRLALLMRTIPARNPIGTVEMVRVYLASSAAHQLLPAPAAEVLRTIALIRRFGYRLRALVGVQVLEKLADTSSICLALGGVWLWARAPESLQIGVEISTAAGIIALGATIGWLRKRPRTLVPVLVLSVVNDTTHCLVVGIVLSTLGIPSTVAEWIVIVGATRLAGMIPGPPGQLVVTEGAVMGTLVLYGIDRDLALAAALIYRLVRFVPVVTVGLFNWRTIAEAA